MELMVRAVSAPAELACLPALEQQVWGSPDPVPVHLLAAFTHAGGVVLVAHAPGEDARWRGFAVAFLGRDADGLYLHSHMVATLPAYQGQGVGRRLKQAQWEWARAAGLDRLVWTYDPLQARNAWFNLGILGARVRAYVPDYYGPLGDQLSGARPSDRLVVEWRGAGPVPIPDGPRRSIPVPADIVALERRDPEAALSEQMRVRAEFEEALAGAWTVAGFRREPEPAYVLWRPDPARRDP